MYKLRVNANAEKIFCRKCGLCCKPNKFGYDRVDIEPSDVERWRRLGILEEVISKLKTTDYNDTGYVIELDDGVCPFLDEDNLCILHKRFGYYAKPKGCRKFNCKSLHFWRILELENSLRLRFNLT
jgi:Fe-S-cluster containining protein